MRNPRESAGHVARGPRKDVRHRKSTGNAATGTGNWTQRSLLLPVRSLAQEGTVSALYGLGHALMLSAQTVHIFLVSDSHPNTASPPRTHPPILALPLRGRPIARDPDTGGHGFSIASPRPCTHPIGPNISYSPGMGFIVLKHSIELKSQELVLRLASVFLAHEAHSTNHVTICAHARSMSMQTPCLA